MSFAVCSCTIGVKQKNTIIYSSMSKALTHKGLIRIATNEKIAVTVGDKATELDLGGYYLIHKSDLQKLLDIARKESK